MPDGVDYAALGLRLRERRRALKLPQARLAEYAGVSPSFIGHLERAEKIPSLETVTVLCVALDIGMDYLVLGKREIRCDQNGCALYKEFRRVLDAYSG